MTTKLEAFNGEVPRDSRKINNNTFSYNNGKNQEVIRLHETDIMRINANGTITLDSGGWKTATTKARMNEYLPGNYRVYQEKYNWYVSNGLESIPFYDGIVLPKAFKKGSKKSDRIVKKEKALTKQINKYIALLDDFEKLPLPGGGDCWFCLFFDSDIKGGNRSQNTSHLVGHLEDDYIMGSILVNSLRSMGHSDDGIGYHLHSEPNSYSRSMIKRALKKFLRLSLGLVK